MANQFYLWQKLLSRFGLWKSEEIPVIVDDNSDLGYEKRSRFYFLMIPLIWKLAFWVAIKKKILGPNLKINTFWFDGASKNCREVKENAATWKALDIIYNYSPGKDKSFGGRVTDFWNNLNNIKALRNRLRLVKQTLREVIGNLSTAESEIRFVSVASGSAQGVIEVMREFKQRGIFIQAIFLDKEPTAIEYSKKLAARAGIINQITFVNKSTRELEEVISGFNPHIIEVIGFWEYRPKEKAIELVKRIYNLLPPDGILLMSTISPNAESLFSHYVGNWPMYYRNLNQFIEILTKGGFNPQDIKIIYEPLKIQKIAICRKSI
jgi:2-polyprenyl-3-methyl-5-hydroxy-6-metoxy-1,4-benzoquinol methylase